MDVHATADGHVVVIHDATVDRTTDGSGRVSDLTLEQIQSLDAAYHWPFDAAHKPYRGQAVRVPSLAQVLRRFPDARLNVEIKPAEPALAAMLCNLLQAHQATQRVLVVSSLREPLREFRRLCPETPTGAHRLEVMSFVLHYKLRAVGLFSPIAQALQIPEAASGIDLTQPGLFAAAARRGLRVDLWTINDEAAMRRLMRDGVSGVMTDRPTLALQVRRELASPQ